MRDLIKKLTSRKLWLAVAGIVTGIAMAFGADEGAVSAVAGAVTAVISVAAYIVTEGRLDAESIRSAAENVRSAAGALTAQTSASRSPKSCLAGQTGADADRRDGDDRAGNP